MLASMLKDMCCEAKIGGHKTNHSLRATGASELFEAGVPEKIIKERTGHRSLEALRLYERTTSNQHQAVSKVLSGQRKTTFQEAVRQQSVDHPTSTYTNYLPQPQTQTIPFQVLNNCTVNYNMCQPPSTPTSTTVATTSTTATSFVYMETDKPE